MSTLLSKPSRLTLYAAMAGVVGLLVHRAREFRKHHERIVDQSHKEEWSGTFYPSVFVHLAVRLYFRTFVTVAQWYHQLMDKVQGVRHDHSSESRALRTFFNVGKKFQQPPLHVPTIRTPFSALINNVPEHAITKKDSFSEHFHSFWIGSDLVARDDDVAILYIHGGGFVSGDVAGFKSFCHKLCETLGGAPVLFPHYRLAPEHSVYESVKDAMHAYEYLTSTHSRVAVVADSAGGCIALCMLQQLSLAISGYHGKANKNLEDVWKNPSALIAPCAAVLLSPITDLTCSADEIDRHAESDVMLPHQGMKWLLNHVVGDECPVLMSPLHAPHEAWESMPPLYFAVASDEMLFGDSHRLAQAAKSHGVKVVEHYKEGVFHTWPVFWEHIPEGECSIQEIAEFLAENLHVETTPSPRNTTVNAQVA